MLDRVAWIAKAFGGKAATWFGRLPRARFNIRAFHGAMLELGWRPVSEIQRRADRLIAEDGK